MMTDERPYDPTTYRAIETERGDGEPAFGDNLAVVLDGDASWREGASPGLA
jgi:hypothetical protein